MKFAYLILAHKNFEQLVDLVDTIHSLDSFIFLHIDKKINIDPLLKNELSQRSVFICDDPVTVSWAGFSQIQATIKLVNMVYDNGIDVDYFHLISGQDFPVKNNNYIKSFFEMNDGVSYMNFFPLPYDNWMYKGMDRILFEWNIDSIGYYESYKDVLRQNSMGTVRSFPDKILPYGGSQWWSLHRQCIEYIQEVCIDGNPIYDFYKKCCIPDEMLFQTILVNSKYKDLIINDNLRYIDFVSGPEYPRVLRLEDYDKITSENNYIFARKFDDHVDHELRGLILRFINNL